MLASARPYIRRHRVPNLIPGILCSLPKVWQHVPQQRHVHDIRNIGVVAHIDAGKTTTSEQMLFVSGETKSVGRVDDGDTVMDYLPQEKERGITISSAAISFKWKGHNINLIDTPGHVDFTIEVERSARVLDGAVVVIDAVAGVQAQTRTVWKQTRKQNIPAIVFVNKMDRTGASFYQSLESVKQKLQVKNVIPLQIPVGEEDSFIGVINLLTMSKITWNPDERYVSAKVPRAPNVEALSPSDELYATASIARNKMLEDIAALDEILMEKFLAAENADDLQYPDIVNALRRLCLRSEAVPALCGASLKSRGVEPLLDSIVTFLPSPADRAASVAVHKTTGKKKYIAHDDQDLCALAFKIINDPARGPMVYIRTYSGKITSKQVLYNPNRNTRERINQLLKVNADDYETVDSVGPGSVACIIGLKHTITGDTLVADRSVLESYVLDGLTIPEAVYSLSIEPEKSSQQHELEAALESLLLEDPSLRVNIEKESGQTILQGIGELHLEIVCDKIRRQFNVEVTTGKAYVAYRESIALANDRETPYSTTHTYNRVIGIKRMFAGLSATISRGSQGQEPTLIVDDAVRHQVSVEEYNSIVDGFKDSFLRGPRGYPLVDITVKVTSIERDKDTTAGAMRACAATYLSTLLRKAIAGELEGDEAGFEHVLLEPIMTVEVEIPARFLGDVLSDLTTRRRATVREVSSAAVQADIDHDVGPDGLSTISADVPLATMLGYATAVRSMSRGEASFSMEYQTHSPVDLGTAQADMLI